MNSEGLVKLSRVWVTCPGCGRQVEAVARDDVIKGWCSISRQRVNFLIETQGDPNTKVFASVRQDPDPDEVVCDYLAGNKVIVIQEKYGITPGKMYRVLHGAGVKLRTSQGGDAL